MCVGEGGGRGGEEGGRRKSQLLTTIIARVLASVIRLETCLPSVDRNSYHRVTDDAHNRCEVIVLGWP